MQTKIKVYVISIIALISFNSCKTSECIYKSGTLCGVVVDENNKPVQDFLITCNSQSCSKQSAVTNESGIFVFPQVNTGKYFIEGSKFNYAKIAKNEYEFYDSSSLICIQVMSLNEILKTVDSFIKVGEFEKGVNLLNSVKVKTGSLSEIIYLCYAAYLNYMLGNEDIYISYINNLKQLKNNKSELFIKKMEACVYE